MPAFFVGFWPIHVIHRAAQWHCKRQTSVGRLADGALVHPCHFCYLFPENFIRFRRTACFLIMNNLSILAFYNLLVFEAIEA